MVSVKVKRLVLFRLPRPVKVADCQSRKIDKDYDDSHKRAERAHQSSVKLVTMIVHVDRPAVDVKRRDKLSKRTAHIYYF